MNSIPVLVILLLSPFYLSIPASAMIPSQPDWLRSPTPEITTSALHTFMAHEHMKQIKKCKTDDDWRRLMHDINDADEGVRDHLKEYLYIKNKRTLLNIALSFDGEGDALVIPSTRAVQKVALNVDGSALASATADTCIIRTTKSEQKDINITTKFPINALSFKGDKCTFCTNDTYCSIDITCPLHEPVIFNDRKLFNAISQSGIWYIEEKIDTGNDNNSIITLSDTTTGRSMRFPTLTERLHHLKSFAADKEGKHFILASTATVASLAITFSENTDIFNVNHNIVDADCRPSYIVDVDITHNGAYSLAAGNREICVYETDKGELESLDIGNEYINTAKFSPCGKFILIGTQHGALLLDRKTKNCTRYFFNGEGVQTVAFSNDGDTFAVGTENAAYSANVRQLKSLFTIGHHLLLNQLQKTESNKVLESSYFQQLFKELPHSYLQERIARIFTIDYKKLGFEECTICTETLAGYKTPCGHSFCHKCLDAWKHKNTNKEGLTCPLCRFALDED